ncbi:MAG TPA: DUF6782 family putative metallopeptidase [Gemmataceae bacterium]|jgi:hypothetical protein|nr:DUF6782 family putative metallopeptidase [Gemmataceae bacterium]
MSKFEDRVNAAAALEMTDRYKALANLDPEIAKRYVIGVNSVNADRLKSNRPLEGFGGFAPHDVDSVMEAALGPGGNKISKDSEEALLIILVAKTPWKAGAKEYMINKLEQNLKFEWSTKSIGSEAPQLLQYTNNIEFVSQGDKYPGTGYHFLPVDFKLIAGLIAQDKLGAWEASDRRTFLHIPEGQEGAQGFYDAETNDIYIVSGLSSTDRQCIFVHEAMHAIRDFRNLPDKEAKYIAADGYIMQAFVALSLGDPYSSMPDRPEEVASQGAAKMLQTTLRSRNAKWTTGFRKAYDDVVDAVATLRGTKDADEIVKMLEDQQGQDAETALVKKILAGLKKKP